MKNGRVRYAFKFALHLCVIVPCVGCQSFRWGERSSDELEDVAKAREVYSKDKLIYNPPPYWTKGSFPGGAW